MECIRLAQSRDHWRILVITEMDLHVRQKAGRFVTILASVGVQRRNRLRRFGFLAGNRRGRCRSVANTAASNTSFLFRGIHLPKFYRRCHYFYYIFTQRELSFVFSNWMSVVCRTWGECLSLFLLVVTALICIDFYPVASLNYTLNRDVQKALN